MATLTPNQKERITNIEAIQWSVSLVGLISGIVYAGRTGGKWYRYLGYSFLGSLIIGIPAALIATPFKNKILKEADTAIEKK